MKTKAIIRIILFSIAILVLTGILLAGMGVHLFSVRTEHSSATLPLTSDSQHHMCTAVADQFRGLEIDWAAGPITICRGEDTRSIRVVEPETFSTKDAFYVSMDDEILKIQFTQKQNWSNSLSKELRVEVPENWYCHSLDIDSASSWVTVSDLEVDTMDFELASGTLQIENCSVGQLDVDAASGDVYFDGRLDKLDCDAASGNCVVNVYNHPHSIDLDAMSGNLELKLPEDCGFTMDGEILSGSLTTDFAVNHDSKHMTHGDGHCQIKVSALSGDVHIGKYVCEDETCMDSSHGHMNQEGESHSQSGGRHH